MKNSSLSLANRRTRLKDLGDLTAPGVDQLKIRPRSSLNGNRDRNYASSRDSLATGFALRSTQKSQPSDLGAESFGRVSDVGSLTARDGIGRRRTIDLAETQRGKRDPPIHARVRTDAENLGNYFHERKQMKANDSILRTHGIRNKTQHRN